MFSLNFSLDYYIRMCSKARARACVYKSSGIGEEINVTGRYSTTFSLTVTMPLQSN
jgi:hypothetical protein